MPTESESQKSAHLNPNSFWPLAIPPPYLNLLEQEDLEELAIIQQNKNSLEYIQSRMPTDYPSQARLRLQILEEIKESGLSEFPSRLIKYLFDQEQNLTLLQWIKNNNLCMEIIRADNTNYFENWIRFTEKEQLIDSQL